MERLHFRGGIAITALASAALLATLNTSLAEPPRIMKFPSEQGGADAWTSDMYRNARPLPMPMVGEDPQSAPLVPQRLPRVYLGESQSSPAVLLRDEPDDSAGTTLYEPDEEEWQTQYEPRLELQALHETGAVFTHGRVFPDPVVRTVPYALVGKLFMKDRELCPTRPGQEEPCSCSGAVIQRRLVLTAAHCLYSFDGAEPRLFESVRFVPAFDRGRAPLGSWQGIAAVVPPSWLEEGRFLPPYTSDFAILIVRDKAVNNQRTAIGERVGGWFGWRLFGAIDNHVSIFGYPGNLDRAERLQRTDAETFRERLPNAAEFGSFQGPFIEDFGVAAAGQRPNDNRVVGVLSYGPIGVGPDAPRLVGTSLLNEEFLDIFQLACEALPGNCRFPATASRRVAKGSADDAAHPAEQHSPS